MSIQISGVKREKTRVPDSLVVGVEWNVIADSWRHIDEFGNSLVLTSDDFDKHPIWGGMRRCTLAADGTVNHYGQNPRGDGLDLTGGDGRVMVEIPKFYVKAETVGDTKQLWFKNGTSEFNVGATLTGGTSGATATIDSVIVTSGSWAGNDAAGHLIISKVSGLFQDNEALSDDGATPGAATSWGIASALVHRWWISPEPRVGFEVHPAFLQRGGIERDYIYVGAFEADFVYDGDNEAYDASHEKLHSRTGKQPLTGNGDCLWRVAFDGGQNEPAIGDDVGTASDDHFFIVDYVKTGGDWATNDATGYLWLRKPGDDSCGWQDDEDITNNTQGNTLAGGSGLGVNGAPSGKTVTISELRTLAGNIGSRWGIVNIWTLSAIQLLFFIEYASGDSQSAIGRGIVDKASGTGFFGELTGADSADVNIGANGTGTGTGSDGYTPVVYRGIENLWGNVWTFVDGYIAVDAEYRIINRDGSGTFADTLAAGDYETSLTKPIVSDGYVLNIEHDELLKLLFIPSAVAGSSSTYLRDYFWAHDSGETNILLSGGNWSNGVKVGVAFLNSHCVASSANRVVGGRLEAI